jgi:mannose-1-phosphate guanylyltransferase
MSNHVVILAGGRATTQGRYRTAVPKPLMPIAGRPVLELMLRHAARHGFTDVTLAVGELAPLIRAMFGRGEKLGLTISYEAEPGLLGSAGLLRTFALERPCLVIDGNVLTTLDLHRFYDAHLEAGNALTIASHTRELRPDFAVLQLGDAAGSATFPVERYVERPRVAYAVSSGVYAIQPEVVAYVAPGEQLTFEELAAKLIAAREPVGAYAHDELSLDVREREDYEQAIARPDVFAPPDHEREAA